MNASPARWRAIAAFAVLTSALSAMLTGCTSKASPAPAAQAPPSAASTTTTAAAPVSAQGGDQDPGPSQYPGQASGPSQSPDQAPAPDPGLTLPRGSRLEVRLGQTIDVKHAASGDRFTGALVAPVVVGNTVAVPAGSTATGEVLFAHRRGMFKGQSVMALTLTRLEVNGTQYHIDTGTLARSKKGKGRRSAAFIGGGAGMGMLIGGVATGGVGLLVGGLAGGGAGALGAAFTGNRDLSIPAESVVTFRLQDALTLAPETQVASRR
jgi:hypothetical protein